MLRISKKADYAVFLLGAIARQGAYPGGSAADSVVSAHEIAKQAGLNKSVVANLLKEFARHNLLDSVRGLRGGYRLASPPQHISLGQILEVVEGKFVLVDCVPGDVDGSETAGNGEASTASGSTASGSTASGSTASGSISTGSPASESNTSGRAPSTNRADDVQTGDVQTGDVQTGDDPHQCALIAFCPSKQPMRVVHQRIQKLFDDIHLDELCSMTPVCATEPNF